MGSGFKGVEAVLFKGAEGGLGMQAQGAAAGRVLAGLEFESVSGAGKGTTPTSRPGHSGYPKISGRVFRVLKILGFENWNPKFVKNKLNPTFRVPDNFGFGFR